MAIELEQLTPLELRLEISKGIANIQSDILKSTYDGKAIVKDYEEGHLDFHVHGLIGDGMIESDANHQASTIPICGLWSARCESVAHPNAIATTVESEVPVFILIGNGTESPRPVDSVIWLQALDSCRMRIVDELEIGLTPSPKTILRVLNWELSALLWRAGIQDREAINEVIKTRPEIVDNFSDENRKASRNEMSRLRGIADKWARGISIHLDFDVLTNKVDFFVDVGITHGFQLRKAFLCPVEPEISMIKRMHEVYLRHEKERAKTTDGTGSRDTNSQA